MKKYIILFLFTYLCNNTFAQTTLEINSDGTFSEITKKLKTLKINMNGYPILNFESLKAELIAWKEKVKSIDINENTKEFTLVHYLAMDQTDLFDVLKKYDIKKEAIISYK